MLELKDLLKDKRFPFIAGGIVLILIVVLAFFLLPYNVQTFYIEYPGGQATKVIESGFVKKLTITIPNVNGYMVLLVVPKQLAASSQDVTFASNGSEMVFKDDPIVGFYKSDGSLSVSAQYNNVSASSIVVLLPIKFVTSLDVNQKQELMNELDKLTGLYLDENGTNYLENTLAVNLLRTFSGQKLEATTNSASKNVFHFSADTSIFSSVINAIKDAGNKTKQIVFSSKTTASASADGSHGWTCDSRYFYYDDAGQRVDPNETCDGAPSCIKKAGGWFSSDTYTVVWSNPLQCNPGYHCNMITEAQSYGINGPNPIDVPGMALSPACVDSTGWQTRPEYYASYKPRPILDVTLSGQTVNYYDDSSDVTMTISSNNAIEHSLNYSINFYAEKTKETWVLRGALGANNKTTLPLEVLSHVKGLAVQPDQKIRVEMTSTDNINTATQALFNLNGQQNFSTSISTEIQLVGANALKDINWPGKVEFGLTSINSAKDINQEITFPIILRKPDELGKSMSIPQIQMADGTPYTDGSIPGVNISVTSNDGMTIHVGDRIDSGMNIPDLDNYGYKATRKNVNSNNNWVFIWTSSNPNNPQFLTEYKEVPEVTGEIVAVGTPQPYEYIHYITQIGTDATQQEATIKPTKTGKEPYLLDITGDYSELMSANGWTEDDLPQTIDTNIQLAYFMHNPLPIELKININKPGVVLAPSLLSDAADYVSQIKGWESLVIYSDDINGNILTPTQIAQTGKAMIKDEYNKDPFTYLLILGDDGNGMIPITDNSLLKPAPSIKEAPSESQKPGCPQNPGLDIPERPAVLDNYYFGQPNDLVGEMDENSHIDFVVSRIPLMDSNSIINYFKSETPPVSQNTSDIIYTDDTESHKNSIKNGFDSMKIQVGTPVSADELSVINDLRAQAVPDITGANSDVSLSNTQLIKANTACEDVCQEPIGEVSTIPNPNQNSYPNNNPYVGGQTKEQMVNQLVNCVPDDVYDSLLDLTLSTGSLTTQWYSKATGFSSAQGNVQLFVNPSHNTPNSVFDNVLENSDLVHIYAHGLENSYFDPENPVTPQTSKKGQIIMAASCHTAQELGKAFIANGASIYSGCYDVCSSPDLSPINLTPGKSIGESFTDFFNASIKTLPSETVSEVSPLWILYGDPTIKYKTPSPTTYFKENKLIVSRVTATDLFKYADANDPQKCISDNNKAEKEMAGGWSITFKIKDINITSNTFNILDYNQKIKINLPKTILRDSNSGKVSAQLLHDQQKMADLNLTEIQNYLVFGDVNVGVNKVPLHAVFLINPDQNLIAFAPGNYDLEVLPLPCYYQTQISILNDNSLTYLQNVAEMTRLGGSLNREFNKDMNVYLEIGNIKSIINEQTTVLNGNLIWITLNPFLKKILYDNNALEHGYAIEFDTT